MKSLLMFFFIASVFACSNQKPTNNTAPIVNEEPVAELVAEPIMETVKWMMARPTCQGKRTRDYSDLRRSTLAAKIERAVSARGTRKEQEAFISIICKESQFDHTAKSPAGALGLSQMMPPTAQETSDRLALGKVGADDLYDEEISLKLGYDHFLHLSKLHKGNLAKISACYNGGCAGATMKAFKSGGLGAHETDNYVASLYNTMEELRIAKEARRQELVSK